MNEALDEAKRIDPRDRELIIGTMRSWLNSEPVWSHAEILQRWGREFLMYRTSWANDERIPHNYQRSIGLMGLRDEAINEFGFCIPCRELLDTLEQHQPIIEIGAGTGYFTALMRKRGIDVIGSDPESRQKKFAVGRYDSEQLKLPGKTMVRRYLDRTVFCAWPSLWHTWFRQALRAMRKGQKLIVVEEDACAEESTWEYRDASFEKIGDWIPMPAWPNLNDRACCWVKRRHAVIRPPTMEQEAKRRDDNWRAAIRLVEENKSDEQAVL